MSRRRTLIGFVAGVVSATVVAGGVAFAAMPSTSNGVTTLCANKSTGAARVIDYQAGKRCTTSERAVPIRPGVVSKGTWSGTTAYVPGDLVRTADGATYLARTSNTGKAPASNSSLWAKVSSAPLPTVVGGAYNGAVNSTNANARSTTVAFDPVPAGTYLLTGRFTVLGATSQLTRIKCGVAAYESDADTNLDDGNTLAVDLPASAQTGYRTSEPLVSMVKLAVPGRVKVLCYTSTGDNGLAVQVRGALQPIAGASDVEPIHGI